MAKRGFPGAELVAITTGIVPARMPKKICGTRSRRSKGRALAPVAGLAGCRAVPAQAVGVHLLPLAAGQQAAADEALKYPEHAGRCHEQAAPRARRWRHRGLLPRCRPGAGRWVHGRRVADGRAGRVRDAHRAEDMTLHIGEEKAVRGGGARGSARLRSPLHEGQAVPEDGEVDVVIVRDLLVDLLDACLICSRAASPVSKARVLLRRNPARWVSSSPKVMVPTPGPLTPVRGEERPDPAADAEMVPGQ